MRGAAVAVCMVMWACGGVPMQAETAPPPAQPAAVQAGEDLSDGQRAQMEKTRREEEASLQDGIREREAAAAEKGRRDAAIKTAQDAQDAAAKTECSATWAKRLAGYQAALREQQKGAPLHAKQRAYLEKNCEPKDTRRIEATKTSATTTTIRAVGSKAGLSCRGTAPPGFTPELAAALEQESSSDPLVDGDFSQGCGSLDPFPLTLSVGSSSEEVARVLALKP